MAYQANVRSLLPILIITLTLMLMTPSVSSAYNEVIDRQGIRVSVLSISLANGHQSRFRVWIATGTGLIDKNIEEISSLEDDQGRVYSPIRMEGFQPGGAFRLKNIFLWMLFDGSKRCPERDIGGDDQPATIQCIDRLNRHHGVGFHLVHYQATGY